MSKGIYSYKTRQEAEDDWGNLNKLKVKSRLTKDTIGWDNKPAKITRIELNDSAIVYLY